jgi:hypothetical protein
MGPDTWCRPSVGSDGSTDLPEETRMSAISGPGAPWRRKYARLRSGGGSQATAAIDDDPLTGDESRFGRG